MQRGEKIVARGPITFGGRRIRKEINELELAKATLANELQAYPDEIPKNQRYSLIDEVSEYEQFKHMNMKTLAAVLAFLNQYKIASIEDLTPTYFTDQYIQSYINKLVTDQEDMDKIIKFKETMLRYSRAILFFREEKLV